MPHTLVRSSTLWTNADAWALSRNDLDLDPAVVAAWVASESANNGMLLYMSKPPVGWSPGHTYASTSFISGLSSAFPAFRPSLSIDFFLPASGALPPASQGTAAAPFVTSRVARSLYVDSGPAGSDQGGTGWVDRPLASLVFALQQAGPGDGIILRAGTYAGSVSIARPHITVQGFPGERAVIAAPLVPDAPVVVSVRPEAAFTTLVNLEIRGGYYCACVSWGHSKRLTVARRTR